MCSIRKHGAIAAQFGRDNDDRGDHHDVEHHVFDDGDGSRCAQATGVGVGGEDDKGGDKWPLAVDAECGDDLADADKLQRDVGHGRQNAGERKGDGEPAVAVAATHIVGQSYVTLTVAYGPQLGQHQHHQRVSEDAVRHREEAGRTRSINGRGHGDDCVRRVEIAADQEPDDERAETAAGQSPLFQAVQVRALPAHRQEACRCHAEEAEAEDDERGGVDGRWHRVRLYDVPLALFAADAVHTEGS